MPLQGVTETVVVQAILDWLSGLGYGIAHGPETVEPERDGDGAGAR